MWFFRSPLIAFGEEALSELEQIQGHKAFLVTDAILQSLGLANRVEKHLRNAGLECEVFSQVEADPAIETVQRCATAMSAYAPDWIVALGGGSVMDTAKSAWFLYERPDRPLDSINPVEDLQLRSKARLILIPTTAGSGSEVSFGVVIKDPQTRQKLELGSYEFLPDMAIVDPSLSAGMPPRLTADTGVDALSHALEGLNSTWSNDFSDALAIHAVRLIIEYLPRAVKNGVGDMVARERMANAATLSGLVINNTNIALAHAFGHSAGAIFHLPHGRVTALFLPYVIEYLNCGGVGRYREVASVLGLPAPDEDQAARNLAHFVRAFLEQLGLPTTLAQAGVSRQQFEQEFSVLCINAQMDTGMVMSRRIPSLEEIERLYECAYHGTQVDF